MSTSVSLIGKPASNRSALLICWRLVIVKFLISALSRGPPAYLESPQPILFIYLRYKHLRVKIVVIKRHIIHQMNSKSFPLSWTSRSISFLCQSHLLSAQASGEVFVPFFTFKVSRTDTEEWILTSLQRPGCLSFRQIWGCIFGPLHRLWSLWNHQNSPHNRGASSRSTCIATFWVTRDTFSRDSYITAEISFCYWGDGLSGSIVCHECAVVVWTPLAPLRTRSMSWVWVAFSQKISKSWAGLLWVLVENSFVSGHPI